MPDVNIDKLARILITDIINIKSFEVDPWKEFYKTARLVIQEYDSKTAFDILEIVIEDLANDTWLGDKPTGIIPIKENKIRIDPSAKELKDKINIVDIAKIYGLKVKGNMAVCPFHADSAPSLSLSNEKGVFNCFGCPAKGDIITFVKMLEELNEKK